MFDLDHALKALTGHIDWLTAWPALSGVAYLFAVSPRLALIDIRERRLPNKLVLPGFIVTFAGQSLAAAGNADTAARIALALISASVTFGFGLVANLKNQIGMGDVKLFALISYSTAWFSVALPLVALGLACSSGATQIAFSALKSRALQLRGTIAFGPHLLVGFALSPLAFLVSNLG